MVKVTCNKNDLSVEIHTDNITEDIYEVNELLNLARQYGAKVDIVNSMVNPIYYGWHDIEVPMDCVSENFIKEVLTIND